jgi:hypothetical protein
VGELRNECSDSRALGGVKMRAPHCFSALGELRARCFVNGGDGIVLLLDRLVVVFEV